MKVGKFKKLVRSWKNFRYEQVTNCNENFPTTFSSNKPIIATYGRQVGYTDVGDDSSLTNIGDMLVPIFRIRWFDHEVHDQRKPSWWQRVDDAILVARAGFIRMSWKFGNVRTWTGKRSLFNSVQRRLTSQNKLNRGHPTYNNVDISSMTLIIYDMNFNNYILVSKWHKL